MKKHEFNHYIYHIFLPQTHFFQKNMCLMEQYLLELKIECRGEDLKTMYIL